MERVLVVDDEPDVLLLLKIIFQGEGYDVRTAVDGVEALAACDDGDIDLVVTDLMMPRMDGNELIRRLRASDATAAIPIVAVSARAEAVEGADAVLSKPFTGTDLLGCSRALLDR